MNKCALSERDHGSRGPVARAVATVLFGARLPCPWDRGYRAPLDKTAVCPMLSVARDLAVAFRYLIE